jgi:hypothetical protein
MIEHAGERLRSLAAAETAQPFYDGADPQRAVVDLARLLDLLGPEQRHCLGKIADEIAAHVEQDGVDPLLGDRADLRGLDRGQIEFAGECGQRIAPIRIGRAAQIVADQLQLGIARARVDERVEQL